MEDHAVRMIWPMFWALFGLAFWIVPTILRHRAQMKALDVIQKLHEKGVPPPPELMEVLKPPQRRVESPERQLRSGVMLVALGLGLGALGGLLQYNDHTAELHPLYAVGGLLALVGLSLIGLWWFHRPRREP